MRDERNLQHLDTCALRAIARAVDAVRIVASISVSDLPAPSVSRWRILDHRPQVAEFTRACAFPRRLCTGLSTDFWDNTERYGTRYEMRCRASQRVGCA